MNPIEFWSANGATPFQPMTAWGARYTGTGSDYERYREQIDGFFAAHARARGMTIVAITTAKGDGCFWVYAVAVPNG